MRTIKLTEETKKNLLQDLLKRNPGSYGEYEGKVADIVNAVRENGDAAVFAFTEQFDKAKITAENIRVTEEELNDAYAQVDPELIAVIRKALGNIRGYHEKQRRYSWFDSQENGTLLGQKVMPLSKVGVYVPGGKAVYHSLREGRKGKSDHFGSGT